MASMLDKARLSLKEAERLDGRARTRELMSEDAGGIDPQTVRMDCDDEVQLAQAQALIGILEALTEEDECREPGCSFPAGHAGEYGTRVADPEPDCDPCEPECPDDDPVEPVEDFPPPDYAALTDELARRQRLLNDGFQPGDVVIDCHTGKRLKLTYLLGNGLHWVVL